MKENHKALQSHDEQNEVHYYDDIFNSKDLVQTITIFNPFFHKLYPCYIHTYITQ